MPDAEYIDDFDDEDAGLIDQAAVQEILEKATDALRGLGLTVRPQEVQITINQGQMYALMPVLIRPSAKKKLVEDQKSKEEFNKMMAAQAEAQIAEEARRIRELAQDPDALFRNLFEESEEPVAECDHFAPDGICTKCGAEQAI